MLSESYNTAQTVTTIPIVSCLRFQMMTSPKLYFYIHCKKIILISPLLFNIILILKDLNFNAKLTGSQVSDGIS